MNKARTLVAVYDTELSWDLDDLDIAWENVQEYYIKYGTLYVTYHSGVFEEHEADFGGEIDYKWAIREVLYDKNYREVLGAG